MLDSKRCPHALRPSRDAAGVELVEELEARMRMREAGGNANLFIM